MSYEFIGQIKNKDNSGLETFKTEYYGRIKYIVSGILKDKSDTEECINDICFIVWNKINLYDAEKSSFATWISVVSRNTAINYLKKQKGGNLSLNENILSNTPSPEENIELGEKLISILNFVGTLSPFERNLFYRRFYYLQNTAQIAAETGKTERSVEGKLYRLRKKLQKEFGGEIL